MNIVLIGYRGSGKSTIGRKLAEQLWKTFVDCDTEICKRFGLGSIKQIFDQHGEAEFRRVESEVTAELMQQRESVIALGGGTLMQPEARRAVEEAPDAVRIYLRCEPAVLLDRIHSDANTAASRPNLTSLGGGIEEIETLLAEREPVYRAVADHELDVSRLSPKDALFHLVRRCL